MAIIRIHETSLRAIRCRICPGAGLLLYPPEAMEQHRERYHSRAVAVEHRCSQCRDIFIVTKQPNKYQPRITRCEKCRTAGIKNL